MVKLKDTLNQGRKRRIELKENFFSYFWKSNRGSFLIEMIIVAIIISIITAVSSGVLSTISHSSSRINDYGKVQEAHKLLKEFVSYSEVCNRLFIDQTTWPSKGLELKDLEGQSLSFLDEFVKKDADGKVRIKIRIKPKDGLVFDSKDLALDRRDFITKYGADALPPENFSGNRAALFQIHYKKKLISKTERTSEDDYLVKRQFIYPVYWTDGKIVSCNEAEVNLVCPANVTIPLSYDDTSFESQVVRTITDTKERRYGSEHRIVFKKKFAGEGDGVFCNSHVLCGVDTDGDGLGNWLVSSTCYNSCSDQWWKEGMENYESADTCPDGVSTRDPRTGECPKVLITSASANYCNAFDDPSSYPNGKEFLIERPCLHSTQSIPYYDGVKTKRLELKI